MSDAEMDEGQFAPAGAIDGEVVDSTEKAMVRASVALAAADMDTSMLAVLTKAELDQQITTARAYPRSITRSMNATRELACLDPATAAECGYSLPRGKGDDGKAKAVTGPSVRLAEIVAGQWGNCRAEFRTVQVDRNEGFVEAEGIFHDLETNYAVRARTRRNIKGKPYQGKPGRIFSDDMINVTANAAGAIAFRNAVFKGVPKPVWAPAYAATLAVVRGDEKTLVTRRLELITAYRDFLGIQPETLFKILGVAGEADVGLDDLVIARGFYSGLKNGEITPEDLLKAQTGGGAAPLKTLAGAMGGPLPPIKESARADLEEKARKLAPADAPKAGRGGSKAADPPHDPETGELDGQGGRPRPSVQAAASQRAADSDPVDAALATQSGGKGAAGASLMEQQQNGDVTSPETADPGETYFLESDDARDAGGKRQTYRDGEPFSKAKAGVRTYAAHPADLAETEAAGLEADDAAVDDGAGAPGDDDPGGDDGADDAERDAGPGPAVLGFRDKLGGAATWSAIRQALTTMRRTDEWTDMAPAAQTAERATAYRAVKALIDKGAEAMNHLEDPGIFALWLDTAPPAQEVQDAFMKLMRSTEYRKLKDEQKDAITDAVEKARQV